MDTFFFKKRYICGLIHMLKVFWLQESVFFQDRMTVILVFFAFPVNRLSLPVGNMDVLSTCPLPLCGPQALLYFLLSCHMELFLEA